MAVLQYNIIGLRYIKLCARSKLNILLFFILQLHMAVNDPMGHGEGGGGVNNEVLGMPGRLPSYMPR